MAQTDIGERFRAWVACQHPAGAEAAFASADRIRLTTDLAQAQISFYPYEAGHEICELRIVRRDDDQNLFFLHFVLEDLDRAQELFGEMADVLAAVETRRATRVLLCCTSALTSSYFASKLNDATRVLGLGYEFGALSYHAAMQTADPYAAILLAPQVAHTRHDLARAHPEAVVFEIPGKVFGTYDATAALRLVMHALRDESLLEEDAQSLRPMRSLHNDFRILVITLFSVRDGARLGYRLYDRGTQVLEGLVRKPRLDFRDIEDLISTMGARSVSLGELDAIGIAVPGAVSDGVVRLQNIANAGIDLGSHLSDVAGIPVFVDNNCNAAAVACYVGQDEYESVVFFRQEFGHEAGGLGTVIDGRLLRGHMSLAGEPKFFERRFSYEPYAGYDDARWTSEGMFQIATNVALASIALTSPEAVYLAVDTVDDLVALRAELARELTDAYVPAIHLVRDYVERVYLGQMALCVQRLRTS